MVSPTLVAEAQALSAEDKLELIGALWQSVGKTTTNAECAAAVDGLREYRSNPTAVRDSCAVMADLRGSHL